MMEKPSSAVRRSKLVAAVPRQNYVEPDRQSASMIDQLLHFSSSLCRARSAAFFWIGDDLEMLDLEVLNIPDAAIHRYVSRSGDQDPIHIERLAKSQRRIATLNNTPQGHPAPESYREHLKDLAVSDEIDLVFWRDDQPLACLAMFRSTDQDHFSDSDCDWEGLRSYMQVTLSMHWRVRSMNVERQLVARYQLKPRELQVVELLTRGVCNQTISQSLNISLATVKTHVVNILDKMGLDSRMAVAATVNQLQYSS